MDVVKESRVTMSDKRVYKWDAFGGSDGWPAGGPENGVNVDESIFLRGVPLDQAMVRWKKKCGVEELLNGTHERQEHVKQKRIDELKRTLDWYERRYPLPYISDFEKEELEEMDTIELSFQVPFGNQRVLDVLDDVCPNDYEAFPIEVHTKTGVITQFFLINVCHRIHDALDKDACIYKKSTTLKEGEENYIDRFKRLVFNKGCMGTTHLGRMHEHMFKVMVSETVAMAFQTANIYGYNTMIFEDRVNMRYRSNYMPDGVTLKI